MRLVAQTSTTPRSKDTCLAAKYRRIASRRGPVKAIVALEHALLTATWHMITNGAFHIEPGGDYFTKLHPDKTKQRPRPPGRPRE